MWRSYFQLTKPGIIAGNVTVAIAGFLLASKGRFGLSLFLAMVFGLSFVVGSACVFNNFLDKDIDKKMKRTKKRALVTGSIPDRNALIFGTLLLFLGCLALNFYTNGLTLAVALFGFFAYVIIYGLAKRKTSHGTVIGSISGAVPPLVGYCAVTGRIDAAAIILFLILIFWQMPHFYAIAIYRHEDYAAAGIPVLPLVKGMKKTKNQMLLYLLGFIVSTTLLTVFGYTGYVYLAIVLAYGIWWFKIGLDGYREVDELVWARHMFHFSLKVIMVLFVAISVGAILP